MKLSRSGEIYFATAVPLGLVKIGFTTLLAPRMRSLSVWSPVPLIFEASAPGTPKGENYIQNQFLADWSHYEWFRRSKRLGELIASIARLGSVPEEFIPAADWLPCRLPHQRAPGPPRRLKAA